MYLYAKIMQTTVRFFYYLLDIHDHCTVSRIQYPIVDMTIHKIIVANVHIVIIFDENTDRPSKITRDRFCRVNSAFEPYLNTIESAVRYIDSIINIDKNTNRI
jgi:hypothetical protein